MVSARPRCGWWPAPCTRRACRSRGWRTWSMRPSSARPLAGCWRDSGSAEAPASYGASSTAASGGSCGGLSSSPAPGPSRVVGPVLPYCTPEWLFDVLVFAGWLAGGAAGVIVLKAAIVALAVWILWLDSRAPEEPGAVQPAGLLIRAALLTAIVVMIRHRFVERPDIVLMVFLAFTIYALNAYVSAGRRWIFALPLVQILWTNMHPSVVVGVLPFAAVLGGGVALRAGVPLVARWWRPADVVAPSWRKLATITAVLAGVLIASALNPHGLDPLTLPFRLADRPWYRQEILELQPPQPQVWPGPFVMTALLLLSLLATASRLPVIAALVALPFVRLGLSAVRFVYLLEIVTAPIVARQLV